MKFTFMRRGIAAVAAASLVTVGAPIVATSASAAEACALGATCEGVLPGTLGESPYKIQMPEKFNGTVLMYSHGYRFGTPVPAVFATPLAADPVNYERVSEPAFTALFGSDVAYRGTNTAIVAPSEVVAQNLLAQGYALAGAGYARQGWAAAEGVEAGTTLLKMIKAGGIADTKKMMVWGDSLGGLVSQTIAENNPKLVAGSLPSCGALEGPEQAFSSAMTLLFTWKTLIAPNLKVANYAPGQLGYGQALTDLGTVLQTLLGVSAGRVTSPLGFAIPQTNLLGGLMAGLPTRSDEYDGLTLNPVAAQQGTVAALAGGFSPVSAGQSSVIAMLQNVSTAAAIGILGRYELEQRVRTIGAQRGILAPTDNVNFNDNVNVSYTNLLSLEQRGEFEDTINSATGSNVVKPLNSMLGALDASRGNAEVRFPANPTAVAIVNALPAPKGVYSVPTLLITTTYDEVVPAGNTGDFFASMKASYNKMNKKKRGLFKAAAFYTIPPVDGWTKFNANNTVNGELSIAALGSSGVGHCVYTPEQLLGAVRGLNAMTNAKTAKKVTAAKRIVYAVPGVNTDRLYLPDPLKKPLLAK